MRSRANHSRTMRFTLMMCVTAMLFAAAPAMAADAGSAAVGYDESGVLNEVQSGGALPTVKEIPSSGVLPESASGGEAPTAGDLPNVAAPRTVEAGADNTVASLPFTGLDVWIIALAGMALLGTGMVLRRTARTNV